MATTIETNKQTYKLTTKHYIEKKNKKKLKKLQSENAVIDDVIVEDENGKKRWRRGVKKKGTRVKVRQKLNFFFLFFSFPREEKKEKKEKKRRKVFT